MEKKTLLYLLFGVMITINMDCKTTNSTAQSKPDEILKEKPLCQQVFNSGDNRAIEKYSYENNQLIKTERFDNDNRSLFIEVTEWAGSQKLSTTRTVGDKAIFAISYAYENGLLVKQEIDDTNASGELTTDGKTDREEIFSYNLSNKDKPLLTKISIERKNMPNLIVEIENSDKGQETKRTTRLGEKTLEVQNTFYEGQLKTKSTVELKDGTILEYLFSYNETGQLTETTRSASNETPAMNWSRQYDCKTEK